MDRDEISGISREFEEVLEQVSAGIQPAEQVTGQPVPDEKLSGQQSFEKNAAARAVQEQSASSQGAREQQEAGQPVSGRIKAWKQPQDKAVKELFYAQEPDRCQKEHNGENRTAGRAAKENEYRDDGEVNGGGNNNGGNNGGDNSEEYNTEEYSEEEYSQEEYSDEEYNEEEYSDEEYSDEGEYSVGREEATRCGGILHPSDGLIAAFFIPVIVLVVIFAQRGIFPFGQESFLRTDMYHQYAPFFSEFHHKLRTGGSLLYSWDIGMGVNFAALYAYYLASPLNWLVMLCPKEYIIEFMTYMIVFKTGLSGLTFSWYLKKHNRTSDFGVGFFGIFYALSGYMAAYSWNIMWLDCILLFPLIMLGLEKLVKEKKGMLYCVTLGLSILSKQKKV